MLPLCFDICLESPSDANTKDLTSIFKSATLIQDILDLIISSEDNFC